MPNASQTPRATVVIPAFKRTRQLELAVLSVMQQSVSPKDYEIIVVDSSPDETNLQLIERLQMQATCKLRCLRKKAEGPGPSRNAGASASAAPILAFMDSDCVASAGWLEGGLAAFEVDTVGLVQGRTMPDPGVAHSVFNWSIQVEQESFLYETANIFYRRNAFEASGGFLPDMRPGAERPLGGEDVDLAWKVKRSDWASVFAEDALVYHEVIKLTAFRWFVNYRLYLLPKMVRDYPELRQFLICRYFFDTVQIWTVIALAGLILAKSSLLALLLLIPYMFARGSEESQTLKGPMKFLRVLLYAPRDFASLITLTIGSLRYRSVVL